MPTEYRAGSGFVVFRLDDDELDADSALQMNPDDKPGQQPEHVHERRQDNPSSSD